MDDFTGDAPTADAEPPPPAAQKRAAVAAPGQLPAEAPPGAPAPPREASLEAVPLLDAGAAHAATVVVRSGYPQFLERLKQPSAQSVVHEVRDFVGDFPANLTRPQAARRIHGFLAAAVPRLLRTPAFSGAGGGAGESKDPRDPNDPRPAEPAEDLQEDVAWEGLEKFVVLKLYKLLFRHSAADLREDERSEACIRGTPLGAWPLELAREERERFSAAVAELQKVDQYRAPRDKAVCLLNAYRIVEGLLVAFGGEARQNVLPALVIEASPPNFYSNVEFTAAFRHPSQVKAEERRCVQAFVGALAAVKAASLVLPPGRRELQTSASAKQSAAGGDEEAGLLDSPHAAAKQGAIVWPRLARVPLAAGGGAAAAANSGFPGGGLPPWFADAGVTLHFQGAAVEELRVGELDELLDEYHKLTKTLWELTVLPGTG